MTKSEIFKFINKNPIFFLATQDKKQPRVRSMTLIEANENGILFYAEKVKDLNRQLSINPLVELCFYNAIENKQIRICGKAEFTDNKKARKIVLEKLPYLELLVEKHGKDAISAYYLKNAKALAWSKEVNFVKQDYVDLVN
jgi:uncharacterized pyridoxamine 5'-phosphate oxidase family protein